ncbi:transcriptional regulator, GntR family [Paramicrobacterium humi]|uniref:Transcriptional regulator, GntR family n=1 Tax=Paramicrobacterium humi TaxID=640635 RepID=A0A1H4LJX6_9MICO|nr:FCD domain-containing protein [Microbacterium humi]SEB70878.1 transcriptional regulator, GntR family [Microbacterium humi]
MTARLESLVHSLLELSSPDETGSRRLPPERELCARLDISRGALREQLAMLENLGVLHRRQGHGSYLDAPDAAFVRTSFTLMRHLGYLDDQEFTQAREMIEETVAAAAAPLVTDDDIAVLHALVDEIIARTEDADDEGAAAADLAFHNRLYAIVDNPIFNMLGGGLTHVLSENVQGRRALARLAAERDPDGALRTDTVHRDIIDALENRDADAARRAMRKHFDVFTLVASPAAQQKAAI